MKSFATFIAPWLLVVLSSLGAVFYFSSNLKVANDLDSSRFYAFSTERGAYLRSRLGNKLKALFFVSKYFEASNYVSLEEFLLFSDEVLSREDLFQVCWSDSNSEEIYFVVQEREGLCQKIDPISDSELINLPSGEGLVATSVYTKSTSNQQKGKLTIFFTIKSILFKSQTFDQNKYFEKVVVTDILSNSSYALNLKGEQIEVETESKNSFRGFHYEELAIIGSSKFVYVTELGRGPVFSKKNLNIIFQSFLIFMLGLICALYLKFLTQKYSKSEARVKKKTKELLSAKVNIEELRKRNLLALQASNIGVWEWNIVTDHLTWDKQMFRLYGVDADQSTKAYEFWINGLHPEDRKRSDEEIQEALKNNKKFDTEFRVVWPDQTIHFIRALGKVDFDESGKPTKVVGVNWDITNEKENESQLIEFNRNLERANAELMQFSYRTSHDLKGPLTTIKELSKFMLEDLDDGNTEEVCKNTKVILAQAESLEKLVEDLLDLAKADIVDGVSKKIDFNKICNEIETINRGLMHKKDVNLKFDVLIEREWLFPRARIFQVINNLVSNGIKYSDSLKENKKVSVKIWDSHDVLHLEVKDNGKGIPYENKQDVFKMFKRFHLQEAPGSGLGMYILKKHLDFLGAEIDFETSEEGTHFKIKFREL